MEVIITNVKNGNKYCLTHFIKNNEYFLIPYNGEKYWEHIFIPQNTWLLITDNFDFSDLDVNRKWFDNYVTKGELKCAEILKNFHNKFKK